MICSTEKCPLVLFLDNSFADFCQKSFLRVFGAAAVLLVLDEPGNKGLVLQNNFSC